MNAREPIVAFGLDVAAAVKLGRPVGEVRQVFAQCRILGCLEPAARFATAIDFLAMLQEAMPQAFTRAAEEEARAYLQRLLGKRAAQRHAQPLHARRDVHRPPRCLCPARRAREFPVRNAPASA